jgi:hypothetical protein
MGGLHPYPPRPPPWGPASPRRVRQVTDHKAVVAFILGLMSLACIGIFTGLPAMVLGALSRRDIDRSNGALAGRGLAAGGIVTGLFGTGFGFVLFLWLMGAAFTEPAETAAEAPRAAAVATPAPSSPPAARQAPTGGSQRFGALEVVDLDESRPLRAQLGEVVGRAHGRTVVLQTYIKASPACSAIAASLPDTRMQRALANVTLVRVDVEEYERELSQMAVETRAAPWFYKLDAKADVTDAISADAWEANVPENIAPVLGKFVHPKPRTRHDRF